MEAKKKKIGKLFVVDIGSLRFCSCVDPQKPKVNDFKRAPPIVLSSAA